MAQQLINGMPASFANLTPRQQYNKLRDITRKRITRLSHEGLLNMSSLVRYENGIPRARDLSDKEIARELEIMKYNLYTKPSGSLGGVREIMKTHAAEWEGEKTRLKARMQYERDKAKIADLGEDDGEDLSEESSSAISEAGEEPTFDPDIEEDAERIFKLTNNIMSLLRSFHLDEAFYRLSGSKGTKDDNQTAYDRLSDQVKDWLSDDGNREEYKYKAFRDIIGPELAKYDEGVEIVERAKTSSRRRNRKKIQELGATLSKKLSDEARQAKNQRARERRQDRKKRKE